MSYDYKKIEEKWHKRWEEDALYKTKEESEKEKCYVLDMFPYPSGEGLHVGHPKGYIATDIFSRMKMMQGFNVLHPMGWDAFGLPAENYALKNKIHPRISTEKNIANYKRQLELLGFSYDWSREIDTTDPEFYKWTQWAFLQMFKKGLAYESYEPIIWCPSCQTGLANEDLEGGKCERCGSEIERKPMRQWVLRITDYADRMLADLEKLPEWEDSIKEMQRNWIGKSEGASIKFQISKLQIPNKSQITKSKITKLYFASSNSVKLERLREIFEKIDPEIEIEPIPSLIEVDEDGKTALENSFKKVEVYKGKYDVPVLAMDTAIFSDGEDIEPTHVKRVALDGKSEAEMTKEEVAEKISDFYKTIAKKHGGEKEFSFEDAWSILLPSGEIKQKNYKREYILTDTEKGERYIDMPLRNIYKSKVTGKYAFEHSKEEYFEEFKHQIEALKELIGETAQEDNYLEVFTTRPDTLFGCTYMVVAPEHELIKNYELEIKNYKEVEDYIKKAQSKSDLERTDLAKEKTGVKIEGVTAINPVNKEEIPIFVADYVLASYGTGAIMAVPAHDERDFEFAQKYDLPIKKVVIPKNTKISSAKTEEIFNGSEDCNPRHEIWNCHLDKSISCNKEYVKSENGAEPVEGLEPSDHGMTIPDPHHATGKTAPNLLYQDQIITVKNVFTDIGININSDFLDGLETEQAKEKIINWLEEKNIGKRAVNYKLQDWVFSRQRYWGEPIPIIHCEKCGSVAVPEEELPVKLPEVEHYEPSGTGESPLATISDWVNTKCPKCGGEAKRETNTMPQWAGSSWYYLRYIDPNNDKAMIDKDKEKYWSPIDLYVGGAEHATRHLIYARFWHKFLYDIGAVSYEEPFTRLQHVGLIMAEDGRKMSKRWLNVINPDDVIAEFGADAMRVYEMFMGPFAQACAWNTKGIAGAKKFLEKVWDFREKITDNEDYRELSGLVHKTVKKVGEDIEDFKFNTAISQMMILVNKIGEKENISRNGYEALIKILAPFAPHLSEELWEFIGNKGSIFESEWPKYDAELIKDETINLVIQINGKLRDTISVKADISEEEAKETALASEKIKSWLEGKEVVKIIFVAGKLLNIVVK